MERSEAGNVRNVRARSGTNRGTTVTKTVDAASAHMFKTSPHKGAEPFFIILRNGLSKHLNTLVRHTSVSNQFLLQRSTHISESIIIQHIST